MPRQRIERADPDGASGGSFAAQDRPGPERPAPNDQLRAARQRLISPSGSGRRMSVRELAAALSAHLGEVVEEKYVAKVERGVIRWPSAARRAAFRGVLAASTDGELGFFITRPSRVLPASSSLFGTEQAERSIGAAPAGFGDVDPVLIPHWSAMLRVLSATHDMYGPKQLEGLVRIELSLIRRHRLAASAEVCLGLLEVESRWAEFASWTADNSGDTNIAAQWLQVGLTLAHQAGRPEVIAYLMMRQAQHAIDAGDPVRALELAARASGQPTTSHRARALSAVRYAQAAAMIGDKQTTATALQDAYRFVARADTRGSEDSPEELGQHCIEPYVRAHEGFCNLRLNQGRSAVAVLEDVVADWPNGYRQDEALVRAWLALAYLSVGRVADAGGQGHHALQVSVAAGSGRAQRTLGRLDALLADHAGQREADEFRIARRRAISSGQDMLRS